MQRLDFSITTLSPMIVSAVGNSTIMTETNSEISGSIIRVVLASIYVNVNKIKNTAYQNADFLKLFYGDLKFLPANPVCNGERAFTLPFSLQQAKSGSGSN